MRDNVENCKIPKIVPLEVANNVCRDNNGSSKITCRNNVPDS